jgi:hypothetical protein
MARPIGAFTGRPTHRLPGPERRRGGPEARLSSSCRRLRILLAGAFLIAWSSATVFGAGCRGPEYRVAGVVVDANGIPLPGARVYVLLDKISEKEFRKQGLRARSVTSDDSGRYAVTLSCDEKPSPCSGKKPHSLTIAAEKSGYATRLRVHRLSGLEAVESPYGCTIQAPDLSLSRSF